MKISHARQFFTLKRLSLSALASSLALLSMLVSSTYISAFDGRSYKLRPPKTSMVEIEKAIRANADDTHALMERALTYLSAGECEKAIADYSRVIKLTKKPGPALVGRSQAYEMMGQHKPALQDVDQAIKLNDKDSIAEALRHKITILRTTKDFAPCPALYERLLKTKDIGLGNSDRDDMLSQRAQVYLILKKPELAIADIQACQHDGMQHVSRKIVLIEAYEQLGKYDQAMELVNRTINYRKAHPDLKKPESDLAKLYTIRARLYDKQGNKEKAAKDREMANAERNNLFDELEMSLDKRNR